MTDERRDRHLGKRMTVRPPDDVKADAQEILNDHGWTMNDFLTACLALLTKNPKAFLARLADFRPPPRRGRPRKG